MVRGGRPGQTFVVDRAFATIGRDPSNDIVIDEPSVSRRHAQLLYRDGWFHVQDLGSANQVAVNGVPVQGSMRIGPGDQIALSRDVALALEWIPASEQTAVMGAASPTPPQGTRAPAYDMPTQQWGGSSTQTPPPSARPQAQASTPPPEQRKRGGISGLTLAFVGCGAILFLLSIVGIAGALVYTGVLPNPLELLGPSEPTVSVPGATATSPSPTEVLPTETSVLPTETSVLPTETSVLPTETSVPTSTSAPAEATATATEIILPTATTAATGTATSAPTPTEVPTETSVPPTATATPPPPTPTNLPPTPTTPPPTPTATTPPPTPLSINHVVENVACISKGQYRINFTIYLGGGTGQYFVYRDIESQAIYGPGPATAIPHELTWGAGSSAVGTLVVRSGGESAESKFYVQTPDCSGF
jgi:hypothetical protein